MEAEIFNGFCDLNLQSNNKNTVTQISIATSLCGYLIISFENMTILFFPLLLLHFSETGILDFQSFNKGN